MLTVPFFCTLLVLKQAMGRILRKSAPKHNGSPEVSIDSTKSSLVSLPCDAWRIIGEIVGLETLHTLVKTGQRSLAVALKRVLFHHLSVSARYIRCFKGDSLADLLPGMSFFAEIQTEELVIAGSKLTPERVYLAARMVASRSRLETLDYNLDTDTLLEIPWLKTWWRKSLGTFVRGACDGSSIGDFATLTSLSVCIASSKYEKDDSQYFKAVTLSEAGNRFAAGVGHRLGGENAASAAAAVEEELPASLINSALKAVACPVFVADSLFSGLNALHYLALTCHNLRDERHFDLRCLPSLATFDFTFEGGGKDYLASKYTAIRISGTERLTTLKLHNAEDHRRSPVRWGGFPLCTRNVPNLQRLEIRCGLWPQYWRRHQEQLCNTLEELVLELCILSDDAWVTSWPPQLRVLELKSIGVNREKFIDYSLWEQVHRDSVQHWRSKIRHLDPRKLPPTLQTLIVEDMSDATASDLELLDTDVVTSWNTDTERFIASSRPRDFSCVLGDYYPCRWGDYLNLCLSEQTLQRSALPCANLTTLELGMHYGGVSNIDLLPPSLTRLSMREITRRMPMEVQPLHSAFSTIFPSAEILLDRVGCGLPNLRSLNLYNGDWSFLLSSQDIHPNYKNLNIMDPDRNRQPLDLFPTFLLSAFAVLCPEQYQRRVVVANQNELIEALGCAWKNFEAENRAKITNWRIALDLPQNVHTLVWNAGYDASARLELPLDDKLDGDASSDSDSNTNEVMPSPEFGPLSGSPAIASLESSSMDDVEVMDHAIDSHSWVGETCAHWNLKDALSRNPIGPFANFLSNTPWRWSFVGRSLQRLELRSVARKLIHEVWSASLPMLDALLITEDLSTIGGLSLDLRNCTHALRELVLLLRDWSLILPISYSNIPLSLTLERFITSNTLEDEQVMQLQRSIPTLQRLEIRRFEMEDEQLLLPSQRSAKAYTAKKCESYMEKLALMRKDALEYASVVDENGDGDILDYSHLSANRRRYTSRFPDGHHTPEGMAKFTISEPASLVFTGATWTALSPVDADFAENGGDSTGNNNSRADGFAMDVDQIGICPKKISLGLIRARLLRDRLNGATFERLTLSAEMRKWHIPEGTETLDLTENPEEDDASLIPFTYNSDDSISILLKSLRLPSTLTSLTLTAIEDCDFSRADLFQYLPVSLRRVHILNQSRSNGKCSSYTAPASPPLPPPRIEDIYTPNLYILSSQRSGLDWAPPTLRRLVCRSSTPLVGDVPETIKTLVINAEVIKQSAKSLRPKFITRQRRKERSNSDTGDLLVPAAPSKKKVKEEE